MLEQVPEWFETWEQSLSRFRADSELTMLNNSAGSGTYFQTSPILWAVLNQALQTNTESSGLVTPAILNELENAGYDRDFDLLSAMSERTSLDFLPDSTPLDEIEMDEKTCAIRLPSGLRLDFGGVAKGWAAHQAAARLAPLGPALVNAGGDIAITAPPRTSEFLPAETDLISATIIAPSAVAAETAAKVVMILGSYSGLDWLEQHPHLSGLMIDENGQRITSPDFSQYLWS